MGKNKENQIDKDILRPKGDIVATNSLEIEDQQKEAAGKIIIPAFEEITEKTPIGYGEDEKPIEIPPIIQQQSPELSEYTRVEPEIYIEDTPEDEELVESLINDDDPFDEIIDEFNVHPQPTPDQQKDAGRDVPEFNLAEQILSHQRTVSSSRRRKPSSKAPAADSEKIAGTVGEVIRESKRTIVNNANKTEQNTDQPKPAVGYVSVDSITMEPEKQAIITDIVARDIARFYELTVSN